MADRDHAQFSSFLAEEQGNGNWCFSYDQCTFRYSPCASTQLHPDLRYNDASATWVLIAAIIVFFMKAGFMLLELSFAKTVKEKRNVVIIKHQDAFASAFGFFLLGFDWISKFHSPQNIQPKFFGVTDPVIAFFNFTFASNAATIVGGCLVTNKYKMRLPAAFISAFVISGILHPAVGRIIWSDDCRSFSPYRFCVFQEINSHACGHNCSSSFGGLWDRMYMLDFAGGGTVHLLGGVAGLMLCLFAKLREWWDKKLKADAEHCVVSLDEPVDEDQESREERNPQSRFRRYWDWMYPVHEGEETQHRGTEPPEKRKPRGFWDWMYPVHGGDETVSEAALGVIILWFCWFAFNCGSTQSTELGRPLKDYTGPQEYPYYGIPAVIAINMILAVATGGTTAVIIAVWAQIRYRAESVNANEIANGILSSLVAITAGCAFVEYWGACLIGFFAVLLYHVGCYLEYKLGIRDTARVVPVHGVCGLWSLIALALFHTGADADCNLHGAYEGLCYCKLRLPPLNYGERLFAQLLAAVMMAVIGAVGSGLMYGFLYFLPMAPFVRIFESIPYCLNIRQNKKDQDSPRPLRYFGGWLLTSPEEEFTKEDLENTYDSDQSEDEPDLEAGNHTIQEEERPLVNHSRGGEYGSVVRPKSPRSSRSATARRPPTGVPSSTDPPVSYRSSRSARSAGSSSSSRRRPPTGVPSTESMV